MMKQSTSFAQVANNLLNVLQGYTKGIRFLLVIFLTLTVSANAWGQTWQKATSIAAGDVVLLVCESKTMELSGISTTSTKYGTGVSYTTSPAGKYELTVETGSSSGTYSLKNGSNYLYWSSGNSLATNTTKNANTSWSITFSNGNATIKNAKDNSRIIGWNASSPRFACYTSSQTAVQLYKKVISKTLSSISISGQTTTFTVGDTFTFGGTVTATYSDKSNKDVTSSATFSGYNMSSAATQTVEVSYTEGGITKTTTYDITVTAPAGGGGGEGECDKWVEVGLSTIESTNDIVIAMKTADGLTYAMPNNSGSSASPSAIILTDGNLNSENDIATTLRWNIVKNGDTFVIYPSGSTNYLYCNNSNSGVRIGTGNNDYNTFRIADNGYLYNIGRARYLGIYFDSNGTAKDWRCYTTNPSNGNNISNQTLKFYKYVECITEPTVCLIHENRCFYSLFF